MKSIRTLGILLLTTIMVPSVSVRGDTFFDFGLRWTQWVPNRGKIQKFEKEEAPVQIPVPTPANAEVSNPAPRSPEPVRPAPTSNGSGFYSGGYSAPSTYVPISGSAPQAPAATPPPAPSTPPPAAPVVTSSVQSPSPSVTAPATPVPNVYPITPPPAANGSQSAPIVSKSRFDALIRMDTGPYSLSDKLLTGQPTAWYASPVVQSVYGGTPNDEQRRTFENDVLQKVQQTYANSGVNLNLTNDSSASAARTISVVSGAGYGADSTVAGITVMNGDGFSFIDKLDRVANVDDLEWAVARNVAHELLHAFNVGHHDTSGTYLDAAVANWDMLLSPDTKFSEDAVADLRTQIAAGIPESATSAIGSFGQHIAASSTCAHCIAAQRIDVQPVPEPATIAMWTVGVALAFVAHRKRQARIA
jgi:hypothetical protein